MSTYQKADESVNEMAQCLLTQFESHQTLIDCKVAIDLVFAYGERDEDGNLVGDALTKGGVKALGICRKLPLKDRAMGRGDAEICLDHDWWVEANESEQRALLDHELHHIEVKIDKRGVCRDDLGRPVIRLRKHDVDVGWFKVIAARHGEASQERIQAKAIADSSGQFFWPQFCGELPMPDKSTVTISAGKESITVSHDSFAKLANKLKKSPRAI